MSMNKSILKNESFDVAGHKFNETILSYFSSIPFNIRKEKHLQIIPTLKKFI